MKLTEVSRGIPHIEDLEVSEFISVLSNWHLHEATEKLDGAQILFGIDENGFYTSRESKGGNRIYNESHYDIRFPTTYMRASHKLLESVLPLLKEAGLRLGDQVEAEVLYGILPNVVPYSEDINYLILLRTTEGKVNIDRLKQKLNGKSLLVPLEAPYTVDGRTIEMCEQTAEWNFNRAPIIPTGKTIKESFLPELFKLVEFGKKSVDGFPRCTNEQLSTLPLNKIPAWCEPKDWKFVKEDLKIAREVVNEQFMKHKLRIKDFLLNHFVRMQTSAFGPLLEDGGWIEGVVLRRIDTGKMVKIVDKDTFGRVREAAWFDRNKITENAKGIEGDHSFLGNLNITLATSIGHAPLGTIQAKNYLRKTDTLIEDLMETISVDSVKDYWIDLLQQKEVQLEALVDKYEREASQDTRLDWNIKQRTLETFASTFKKLRTLKEESEKACSAEDLLKVLVGKQLGEI